MVRHHPVCNLRSPLLCSDLIWKQADNGATIDSCQLISFLPLILGVTGSSLRLPCSLKVRVLAYLHQPHHVTPQDLLSANRFHVHYPLTSKQH